MGAWYGGWVLRAIVGTIGSWFIVGLVRLLGKRLELTDYPWLAGPLGGAHIGGRPYDETAVAEGLCVEREAREGGLVPDFAALAGSSFDPTQVHPAIRDFYQQTSAFRLDAWSTTYFPARLALWLLVTTISRRVDQLNFPLDGLAMSEGMTSEIVHLRRPDGSVRYTGWFRRLARDGAVIYTGFYMLESPPLADGPCVKVVFPMPDGNATVLLRPRNDGDGLRLESIGRRFGQAGFYRLHRFGDSLRVWRVATLHETFHLRVDDQGDVRCNHDVRFFGMPVLTLHYRCQRRSRSAT